MTQSSKRGLFTSVFGSKKKSEEELEAERAFHRKLEDRIREVLLVVDPPKLELPLESKNELPEVEIESVEAFSIENLPPDARGYSFLQPTSTPETLRKPPSAALFQPRLRSLTPAAVSQSR